MVFATVDWSNMVLAICTALPALLAAIATFIAAIRNGNKTDEHGAQIKNLVNTRVEHLENTVKNLFDERQIAQRALLTDAKENLP